ncbi:hypothetical protein D3C86_1781870 [compost metagenome]
MQEDLLDRCGDLRVVLFTHFTGAVGVLENEDGLFVGDTGHVGTAGVDETWERSSEARSWLTTDVILDNVGTQTTTAVQTHFTLFHFSTS